MKPFTKEQLDALDDYFTAKIYSVARTREGGWGNDTLNSDFERLQAAKSILYALLVNDSEPVHEAIGFPKQCVKTFWSNPGLREPLPTELKTYNPETHIVMPRVWSEEEWSKITVEIFNHSSARTWPSKPIEDIHYAITKVFGGDK